MCLDKEWVTSLSAKLPLSQTKSNSNKILNKMLSKMLNKMLNRMLNRMLNNNKIYKVDQLTQAPIQWEQELLARPCSKKQMLTPQQMEVSWMQQTWTNWLSTVQPMATTTQPLSTILNSQTLTLKTDQHGLPLDTVTCWLKTYRNHSMPTNTLSTPLRISKIPSYGMVLEFSMRSLSLMTMLSVL